MGGLNMTTKQNKEKIKKLVKRMLKDSHDAMVKKIDKALDRGCVDVDGWDEVNKPCILPYCIASALLKDESVQYDGRNTAYEKEMQKTIKNIQYFI
jgi:hypothetical protein